MSQKNTFLYFQKSENWTQPQNFQKSENWAQPKIFKKRENWTQT